MPDSRIPRISQAIRVFRETMTATLKYRFEVPYEGKTYSWFYEAVITGAPEHHELPPDRWPFYVSSVTAPYNPSAFEDLQKRVGWNDIKPTQQLDATIVFHRGCKYGETWDLPEDWPEDIEDATKIIKAIGTPKVYCEQDIRMIPAWGETFEEFRFFTRYKHVDTVDLKPGTGTVFNRRLDNGKPAGSHLIPWRALFDVSVQYLPNCVRFQWLSGSKQMLQLRLINPGDGKSGFAFAFAPKPNVDAIEAEKKRQKLLDLDPQERNKALQSLGIDFNPFYPVYHDILHIKICGDVEVGFANATHPTSFTLDPLLNAGITDARNMRYYKIARVKSLAELPLAGDLFTVTHDASIPLVDLDPAIAHKIGIDFVLGSMPIAGELLDLGDLYLALTEGHDRWGDKTDGIDKFLIGLSVFIPLVSSQELRALVRMLR